MNLLNQIRFILVFYLVLFTTSCKDDLIAESASYIKIEHFNYDGNSSIHPPHPDGYESFNSTNITDAWISMDGQIIGNFEIPLAVLEPLARHDVCEEAVARLDLAKNDITEAHFVS